jgi:hypothetical protein
LVRIRPSVRGFSVFLRGFPVFPSFFFLEALAEKTTLFHSLVFRGRPSWF